MCWVQGIQLGMRQILHRLMLYGEDRHESINYNEIWQQ